MAAEALTALDSTILNADVNHKFMIDKLSAQNSTISRELELILRISISTHKLFQVLSNVCTISSQFSRI